MLTCILYQVVTSGVGRPWLSTLKQVRVVAALAQLHHNVEQPRPAGDMCFCSGVSLEPYTILSVQDLD